MKQVITGFGLLILALLILFRLPVLYPLHESSNGIWVALFSIIFLALGIFLSRRIFPVKKESSPPLPAVINYQQLLNAGISKREADIILLINEGLSNQQIADKLFVSENTIKKHISNIFQKLQVERRTEAIKKARELSAGQ